MSGSKSLNVPQVNHTFAREFAICVPGPHCLVERILPADLSALDGEERDRECRV